MDHDHHFPAEKLSETDRVAALARLIEEFDHLKTKGDEDLIHKRRQMLLSLWGDLVLSRQDPNQVIAPDDKVHAETSEMEADADPSHETDISQQDEIVVHSDAHSEPHTEGGDAPSTPHEMIDASPHEEAHIDVQSNLLSDDEHITEEMHEEDAHTDHPLHEEAPSEIAAHLDADESPHEAVSVVIEDVSLTHDEPSAFDIVSDAHAHHQPAVAIIADAEDHTPAALTIHPLDAEHRDESLLEIAEPTSAPSPDEILAKIFDVKPTPEAPLLEIKDVAHRVPPETEHHVAHSEPELEHHSPMVRLRLLKTGVLHDLVLPQGTIVSTNAADAEELISSGTAEKLLIQTETDDE